MQLIACDFETFYSREFSLSRLSTEQYVRHELFEPIGFSIKLVDHFNHPASWCTGDKAYLQKRLDEIDWSQVALLAHNTVFDGFILSHHFGIQPALYLDTLSMGRALHGTEVGGSLRSLSQFYNLGEKGNEVLNALGKRRLDFTPAELAAYGAYCCNDTELTAGLFQKMVGRFPADEIQFIDLTIRMFCDPQLVLDRPILEENLVTTRRKKQELMAKWQQMLGCTAVEFKAKLMSNPQFADMLRQCGVEPPAKISPRTGQTTYALAKSDEGFKALLDHAHPAVQALCAARVGAKSTLEETRTENLIAMSQRGAVPVLLKYYGAHTGRYGGGDGMNWQNLPRKSKINYAVQAPPKYILTGADSSSIEARMNVWNAGQQDVVDLYLNKEDVYKHMAASIYNKPVHLINDAERFLGKQVVLGAGYGLGKDKFQRMLKTFNIDMPLEECDRIIKVYRARNWCVKNFWNECGDVLKALEQGLSGLQFGKNGMFTLERGGILMPNGMRIRYPNVRHEVLEEGGKPELVYDFRRGTKMFPKRIYSMLLTENLIQGTAFAVIKYQMLLVAKRYKIPLNIHDAIIALARVEEGAEAQAYLLDCMHQVPDWARGAPIAAEGKFGLSLGDL